MITRMFNMMRIFPFDKKENFHNIRDNFITYRIITPKKNGNMHILQCSNTRNIFKKEINEIIYDNEILFKLPPSHSCYLGIQFAKILQSQRAYKDLENGCKSKLAHKTIHRYGKYCFYYQDRSGKIFFIDTSTKEGFSMDPIEIVQSKDLINEFDASQSFYIGFAAGLSLKKKKLKPALKLIK